MKNLSLFVTLSLLTLMGIGAIVKANPAENNLAQSQDPNSSDVIEEVDPNLVDPNLEEVQPELDSLEKVQPEEMEVIPNDTSEVELPGERTQVTDDDTTTEDSTVTNGDDIEVEQKTDPN